MISTWGRAARSASTDSARRRKRFLGKDLSQITLPEAAELAGMIQNPAHYDPYRHPDRVKDRRNLVLGMMRQNGYVNDRDYALALDAPVVAPKGAAQSQEAPTSSIW